MKRLFPHYPATVLAKLNVPTRIDIWISAADYRLIREQRTRHSKALTTSDFSWLPRTSATLTILAPDIPDGFKHSGRSG